MGDYIDQRKVFPRVLDNLLLLDYPSLGNATPVRVDYIEVSKYDYFTSSLVTSATSSAFANNLVNNIIPNDGHLYLILPTVAPDVVAVPNTATLSATTVYTGGSAASGGDFNSRIVSTTSGSSGAGGNVVFYQESCRVRLNMPATIPWWGIDSQSSGGYVDWIGSSPEAPNATWMWAVTDAIKYSTIQMQFEMPKNNQAATAGIVGNVHFLIGFVAFSLLPKVPSVYTPIQTQPPNQGSTYQAAVGARQYVSA
jgi:hypothetical protein